MTYLVYDVATGVCVNTIVYDGVSPYYPGPGLALDDDPSGLAGIGWVKTAAGWTPPDNTVAADSQEPTVITREQMFSEFETWLASRNISISYDEEIS